MNNTRPVQVPDNVEELLTPRIADEDNKTHIPQPSLDLGDLDFDKEGESYVKNSLNAMPEEIEKLRTKYYETLPAKLATARELARGIREPTKAELENPPPTEVELRAERSKKERRWRDDLEGWEIVKPSANPSWDERFRNVLRIFIDPQDESEVDHTNPS
jgi:import inner membrane translocase subunit TIM54